LLKDALQEAKKAGDAGATLVRDLGSRISGSATSQRPEVAAWKCEDRNMRPAEVAAMQRLVTREAARR